MKVKRQRQIFRMNQIGPGIQMNGSIAIGGSQPPRNRIVVSADIRIMLAYSPRKNSAKDIELYSTKKPATSSDSPSGRSKGARFVSAKVLMKKMTNIGKSGMKNQTLVCARTTSDRFSEPTQSSTVTMTKPIETS